MEDFRTKFQNVSLTANNVSIFFANLKAFRFFKSTGISSQRTDAEKATVCFPMLVRSFGFGLLRDLSLNFLNSRSKKQFKTFFHSILCTKAC